MIAFAKLVINDLSAEVLEYPEITIPEQGLKRKKLIDKIFCNHEISEIWITFPDPQQKIQRKKHRLTNAVFMSIYKKILKKDGVVNLKTDSEFLHGYTLGVIEGMGIDPIFSNHDIYSNNNAPKEVLEIKTFYEKKFIDSKKITFLKFKFD